MTRKKNNCASWNRGNSNDSVECQKQVCAHYAKEHGFHVKRYYGGVMNCTTAKYKKELMAMVRDVKEDESISKLICANLTCLGRDIFLVQSVIKELQDAGVTIVAVNNGIDTESESGTFMLLLALQMQELERQILSRRRKKTIK